MEKTTVIRKNIFGKAAKFSQLNYKELKMTHPIKQCNAIYVSHQKKIFWLTKILKK